MDIDRPDFARKRRRRRIILIVGGVLGLAAVTLGLTRLQPAAPSVDKAMIYTDTVKRGEMLRQVRGNGTLVPEEILWIPTINQGRVERILVLPGAAVKADTVLVELGNPEVEKAAFDAAWQLKGAEAELTNLRQKPWLQALIATIALARRRMDFAST